MALVPSHSAAPPPRCATPVPPPFPHPWGGSLGPDECLSFPCPVLREDGFGARPQYECYLAELPPGQTNKEGGSVVGYVLFTYTYSTWKGRNLYMDNLYVQPQFRGQKIGKRLIEKAAQAAVSKGCGQLRMHVANWKAKDKDFLARQGGEDLTAKEGWTLFNLDEDALRRLAAQSTI
uniref:N-acetyltransferase domain-containing protein n=1 Tax=Chelonoidis abingdonii TaxID=106734 RepID=A0A8C0GDI5_CHEAB